MGLFQIYRSLGIDGSLIGFTDSEIAVPHFCYPVNATAIGFEGCILYCFLPQCGEMVFASNPESCAETYVYPLAETFEDFMRLVITCGSANPVEQIVWMSRAQFDQHLQNERALRTAEQIARVGKLREELKLSPMDNPYEYVKASQTHFDGSQIPYSDAYYDILGQER